MWQEPARLSNVVRVFFIPPPPKKHPVFAIPKSFDQSSSYLYTDVVASPPRPSGSMGEPEVFGGMRLLLFQTMPKCKVSLHCKETLHIP